MTLRKLPATPEELEAFKREMATKSPLEILRAANAILKRVNDDWAKELPGYEPLDTSGWTFEQKMAAGDKVTAELAKLARNIPELRRLSVLDAESAAHSASQAAAVTVIQLAKDASR